MVDIQGIILNIITWAPGVIFAITLHEWAHGFVASRFGDSTPALMGRLTLNPIPHIDLMWTIVIPMAMLVASLVTTGSPFVFGGAKPVPINPRNFRPPQRLAMFMVSIAGPAMNLLVALLCALAFRGVLFLPEFFRGALASMLVAAILMNILLAVFNMLPIPPLDGGRVAVTLLPSPMDRQLAALEPYGMPLILVLAFSGVLGTVINPLMAFFVDLFLSAELSSAGGS